MGIGMKYKLNIKVNHVLLSIFQQPFQTRLTTSTVSLLNEVKRQQNGKRYVWNSIALSHNGMDRNV